MLALSLEHLNAPTFFGIGGGRGRSPAEPSLELLLPLDIARGGNIGRATPAPKEFNGGRRPGIGGAPLARTPPAPPGGGGAPGRRRAGAPGALRGGPRPGVGAGPGACVA